MIVKEKKGIEIKSLGKKGIKVLAVDSNILDVYSNTTVFLFIQAAYILTSPISDTIEDCTLR